MAPGLPLCVDAADAEFDQALDVLEAELGVVFASTDRVEAACSTLRRYDLTRATLQQVDRLTRIIPLAIARVTPATASFVRLLRHLALTAPRPWPLLENLLHAHDPTIPPAVLADILALAERGALVVDDAVVARLADVVERDGSPVANPAALRMIAYLIGLRSGVRNLSRSTLLAQLTGSRNRAVRRLTARVLDLDGAAPDTAAVEQIIGPAAARILEPALAYSRATYVDLVDVLAGRPGPPLAISLPIAERHLGRALAREAVASFGWSRANRGLEARPLVGVSVNDSLPLLVTPAEAHLFDDCPAARRVFDRFVIVAHGGHDEERGDTIDHSGSHAAGATPADVITRFKAYNLRHAEVLGEILDIAPVTVERVHAILAHMDRITEDYVALFGARSSECEDLPGFYGDLKHRILHELTPVSPGEPLPAEATRLVQMFEDPSSLAGVRTLHGLKRYLHQRGLALGFSLLEGSLGTNRTVDIAIATKDRVQDVQRRIEYVDFEPPEGRAEPEEVPYAVAVVADGFARQLLLADPPPLPAVKVFCYGNEAHYFVSFRNHPVFIRIDYSPPLAGGMIDLQYYGVSKYELDEHPSPSLDAIQAFFRQLEFDVTVENTRIHARYDKERATSLADICDKAEALFRLAPYLMDVDWTIGQLALPAAARRVVGEAWAEFFARWGTLPVRQLLTADRRGVLWAREPDLESTREVAWDGRPPYRDRFTDRPGTGMLAALRAAVAERQLPEVHLPERDADAAQLPLERLVFRPLRRALARGEIVASATGLAAAPTDLFERRGAPTFFARLLDAGPEALASAARLAGLVAALERSLRLESLGSVDGYEVLGSQVDLRGDSVGVYALRDASGIIRLACFAPGGALVATRSAPGEPWLENASTNVSLLTSVLRRNNILPAWIDAPGSAGLATPASVAAAFATPNPRAGVSPLPGERTIAGTSASPGRATGLARLGTAGRIATDVAGEILIAPTVGPDDNALLFKAAGVVCTGGGILSHAGLLAVQFGRPALIIPGSWMPAPEASLAFRRVEFAEIESRVGGRRVTERRAVRECEDAIHEGDLVELDADAGTLRVLGQHPAALALVEDLRRLSVAHRVLAASTTDSEVLAQRGHRLRALHQLATLLGRLDDPALAAHAARQLLAGATTQGSSQSERAALLAGLLDNRSVAGPVRRHLEDIFTELRRRRDAAAETARARIPTSESAVEILALRLQARHGQDAVAAAERALAPGLPQTSSTLDRGASDLDELAGHRLDVLWQQRLERCARAAVNDSRPAGATLRHELRELERLARVRRPPAHEQSRLAQLRDALVASDASTVRALANRHILCRGDGGLELHPLVGWKAANLGEVARLGAGGAVPSWFVVTDLAFREALAAPVPPVARPAGANQAEVSLEQAIGAVLARRDTSDAERSATIRHLWTLVEIPPRLAVPITTAYRQLSSADQEYVAIRSSAAEEDTEAAARAGEFDTFLFIRGEGAVLEHVKRAWSGLWSERALHNRAVLGAPPAGPGGGVLVQRMVRSRVSGVLQTVNTAGGHWREMVINVGLGLGEGIVSGSVGADQIVVSKDADLTTAPLRFRYMTADKRQRVVFDERAGTGTLRVDTVSHQRFRPALEYIELLELVQLAARLEAAYGYPLDIEFGFEGPELRLLQVRPAPGCFAAWSLTEEQCPFGEEVRA